METSVPDPLSVAMSGPLEIALPVGLAMALTVALGLFGLAVLCFLIEHLLNRFAKEQDDGPALFGGLCLFLALIAVFGHFADRHQDDRRVEENRAMARELTAKLATLGAAAEGYYAEHGRYPARLADLRGEPKANRLLIGEELPELRFEPSSDRQSLYIETTGDGYRDWRRHRFGLYLKNGEARQYPCQSDPRVCAGDWSAGIQGEV